MGDNLCICKCSNSKLLPLIACYTRRSCSNCLKFSKQVYCKTRRNYIVTVNRCLCRWKLRKSCAL